MAGFCSASWPIGLIAFGAYSLIESVYRKVEPKG